MSTTSHEHSLGRRFAGVDEHATALRSRYTHLEGTAGHKAVITILSQALGYWSDNENPEAAHAAIDAAGRILSEIESHYEKEPK